MNAFYKNEFYNIELIIKCNMNHNLNQGVIIDYNDYNKYFMTNLIGRKYIVYLNPLMNDIDQIIESIKTQLPESYNIEDLKILCEGRNLKSFDSTDFPHGIGEYFNKLNTIYVIGGNVSDRGAAPFEAENRENSICLTIASRPPSENLEFLKERLQSSNLSEGGAAARSGERVYYMTNLIGKKYPVYLNPLMSDKTQIIESIKTQLPESYNNENFKIICKGKSLSSYDSTDFKDGVHLFFKDMEKIYIVGWF